MPTAPPLATSSMGRASARFEGALGGTAGWVTVVSWSNDGVTWQQSQMVSGSVTRDLTSTTHWSAELVLIADPVSLAGINPFNTRVRIQHGIDWFPTGDELLPFGMYAVNTATFDYQAKTLTVDLTSYETFPIRATYVTPKNFAAGSADSVLRAALSDLFPDVSLTWDDRIRAAGSTTIPAVTGVTDRWSLIDGNDSSGSVAAAISARVIADAAGGFTVVPIATLQDSPVASVDSGSLLISRSDEWSADGVANIVAASGSTTAGDTIGPAIVRDTDPNSATYWKKPIAQGGFGQAPYVFTSSLITSVDQALKVAQSQLAQRLGLTYQVSFGSIHNPLLQPGDVITVDGTPLILDAITWDLSGGPMTATTRAQSASLTGTFQALPTDLDGS